MTFARFFQVAAICTTTLGPLVTNLDGDGLRVDWRVLQTSSRTIDEAQIVIWNLDRVTRNTLAEASKVQVPALNVQLLIGWDRVTGLVHNGQVYSITPEQVDGQDVKTTIRSGDGLAPLRDAPAVPQPLVDATLQIVFDTILQKMSLSGVPIIASAPTRARIAEKIAAIPLPRFRNWILTGDPTADMDEFMDTIGLSWTVRNLELRVFDFVPINEPPPILSPQSGLLQWQKEDDGGIKITALADPRVTPGAQVIALDSLNVPIGAPAYRVRRVEFIGTTSGRSQMIVDAVRSTPL